MGVVTDIIEPAQLIQTDVQNMFGLMQKYFDGVSSENFHKDLLEKKWVILLRDEDTGDICGFTTITVLSVTVEGRTINAIYSGDTIINKENWHAFSLEKAWIPFVFSLVQAQKDISWYWFLVCKGYRTYRYLPVHFKSFWPSPDVPIPSLEKKILHRLGRLKFGEYFYPEDNLVKCPSDYWLKQGVSDITTQKKQNRYIQFFVKSNPGWVDGDELACIVPLQINNTKKSLQRILNSFSIGTT